MHPHPYPNSNPYPSDYRYLTLTPRLIYPYKKKNNMVYHTFASLYGRWFITFLCHCMVHGLPHFCVTAWFTTLLCHCMVHGLPHFCINAWYMAYHTFVSLHGLPHFCVADAGKKASSTPTASAASLCLRS